MNYLTTFLTSLNKISIRIIVIKANNLLLIAIKARRLKCSDEDGLCHKKRPGIAGLKTFDQKQSIIFLIIESNFFHLLEIKNTLSILLKYKCRIKFSSKQLLASLEFELAQNQSLSAHKHHWPPLIELDVHLGKNVSM